MSLFTLEEVLGEYNETKDSITLRPYYKRIISELKIAFRYKNYHSLYFIKILKILFSKKMAKMKNILFKNGKNALLAGLDYLEVKEKSGILMPKFVCNDLPLELKNKI